MSNATATKATHTPGPWTVTTVPTQIGHCHKIMPLGACLYIDRQHLPHDAINHDSVVGLANARLIAAAPDLLLCCEALVSAWDTGAVSLWSDEDLAMFRAAIAKANNA